jgi:farnesol dehydrogenase
LRVLVTGVTGFLGGRLADGLTAAGHQVRGLVRDPGRWTVRPPDAECATGDVTDREAVLRAARDCQAVVHAAALVRNWARDRRAFDRVNVGGTRHVAEAAREAGARLVLASSFLALGPTDGTTADEASVRPALPFRNDYERTKWLADQLGRQWCASGLDVIRLYPGVLFGPGALTEGNHLVGLLLRHGRGELPGVLGPGDRRMSLAFVDDVVAGFVAALERAPSGSAFVLGGENRTLRELFAAFAAVAGIPPPRRSVPYWAAAWVGRLERIRAACTGIEPRITDQVVALYRHEWAYSSARAERGLDYRITPLVEALGITVRWLREQGELAPGSRR